MTRTTHTLTLGQGVVDIQVDVHGGQGRPFLLLHGGAGPQSMAAFAGLLAEQGAAQVFVPAHPGFDGTIRPNWLTDVPTLARVYAALLDALDLRHVVVVGNSLGGWTAAELAALGPERAGSFVLVNAVGIHVPGHPIVDALSLPHEELTHLSFHDPSAFAFDPRTLPEAQRAVAAANRATMQVYSGPHAMADPTLPGRLAGVVHPTLVAWGASDRIVDADYGRAFAGAIPGAQFRLLPRTGHMPQIETPGDLLPVVRDFADAHLADRSAG
jgi:pimeloyl-ACP methyl ester carboxylesterase